MSDAEPILTRLDASDPHAAEEFLPRLYSDLRKLAAIMLAHEKPGQTLEPTGLVHEAYLRLAADKSAPLWQNPEHFFAAAARTMRRILVDLARQKSSQKKGGNSQRVNIDLDQFCSAELPNELLAVNEALIELSEREPIATQLVELHYFGGLTLEEAAAALQISVRTAYRYWAYARAWLHMKLRAESEAES
jgi:RNA polymerase sigma factor (TIGR02999 family)